MLKNYLIIIWRHFAFNKWFSFIKILSLTVGLSVFTIIFAYLRFECSYDRYHKYSMDIFRVLVKVPGAYMGKNHIAVTPGVLAPSAKNEFAEIAKATRIELKNVVIDHNLEKISESGFICVDPDFVEMFSFPIIKGETKFYLQKPYTLLITELMAEKYFGVQDPIGKTLTIDKQLFTVEGIIKDLPRNSTIQFGFLTSFLTAVKINGEESINSWNSWEFHTFIQVLPNVNTSDLEIKLNAFLKNNYPDGDQTLLLQPLKDIHLFTQANFDLGKHTDSKTLLILMAIGAFILIIACLNYINLTTARAINRAKEVGLRKVMGAGKLQLIWQFVGESVVITFVSLLLSLFFAYQVIPIFGNFIGQILEPNIVTRFGFLVSMVILSIITGLFSGFYPAFILSSMQPNSALKGDRLVLKGLLIRNMIVTFQIFISVVLIFGSLVVMKQFNFLLSKDLGFKTDNILAVRFYDRKVNLLKTELSSNKNILDFTASNQLPTNIGNTKVAFWEGKPNELEKMLYKIEVDRNFLDFYGVQLIQSENSLSGKFGSNSYIINQSAVNEIGWSNPVGEKLGFNSDNPSDLGIVVGLVKDFNFTSLRLKIEPLAISFIDEKEYLERGWLSIRLNPDSLTTTLSYIKQKWEKVFPDKVFSKSFISDGVKDNYQLESKLRTSLAIFTLVAIFIAGLGLFGLATYSAERRRKEIGIRKVMGATTNQIVVLQMIRFLKIAMISVILALPAGFFIMHNWLQEFAYRISIGWSDYAIAIGLMLVIMIVTIGFQTVKASITNPVDTLKYE